MDASTLEFGDLLVAATLVFGALSAVIVLWFLWRRPALDFGTKIGLLLGIFIFPLLSAGSGNVAGFEATKKRTFCAGCHVMHPYTDDSNVSTSTTLASLHGRNRTTGPGNCYGCHADYSMYGTALAKTDGMIHVMRYYTRYAYMPAEDAFGEIELYRPFRNEACTKCHSMQLPGFLRLQDHRGMISEIRSGVVSCVGSGCHGPVHPFSKRKKTDATTP